MKARTGGSKRGEQVEFHVSRTYREESGKVLMSIFLALCCESVYLAVKERIPRLAPVKQKSPSMIKGCSLSAEIIEARGNITFFTFLCVPQI
jgi:hypothetical protein